MPVKNEIFKEAREMMEKGELPDKVSQKLLWASTAEVYRLTVEANSRITKVENHFLMKLSPKKALTYLGGFLAIISPIYIKESRDLIFGFLLELLK
jgi:hypothetical protein